MIAVKTMRGPFRLVELFYPRPDEIAELGEVLGLNQIIYIRQATERPPNHRFGVRYQQFETSHIDLTRDLASLFGDMSSTTRRMLRKAELLSDRIEVHRNDPAAQQGFITVYNGFVSIKHHTEQISERRLAALEAVSDVISLYFDSHPVSAHLVLRDPSIRRVSTLLLATARLNGEYPASLVSLLNRWLHWHEMDLYKSEGMCVYDLCGIGRDTPEMAGVADFKLSFGGTPVTEHNYMLARLPGRAAVGAFYTIRAMRAAGWAAGLGRRAPSRTEAVTDEAGSDGHKHAFKREPSLRRSGV